VADLTIKAVVAGTKSQCKQLFVILVTVGAVPNSAPQGLFSTAKERENGKVLFGLKKPLPLF
jgi:hypothetical protein